MPDTTWTQVSFKRTHKRIELPVKRDDHTEWNRKMSLLLKDICS